MALRMRSVETALNLIWHRWNGIKHVWTASGEFPFPRNPELNDGIVIGASQVVFLQRRNLLRRYVSNIICNQLNFWIGTRHEYLAQLESVQLQKLDSDIARHEIKRAQIAVEQRLRLFRQRDIRVMHLLYEDMFGDEVTTDMQFAIINNILQFLEFREISRSEFNKECVPLLDKDKYQWGSVEVYRRIPGIEAFQRDLGSDETGWLF